MEIIIPVWQAALVGVGLIAVTVLIIMFLKKFLVNAVLGVTALVLLNIFGAPYGLKIGINLVTVLASALLGLAGVGALIILALLGIRI